MKLYHGTTTGRLADILENGLIANKTPNWEGKAEAKPFVYLTDTYPGYYAGCALRDDVDEKPVILEVEVDDLYLLPDEDYVGHALELAGEGKCIDLIPDINPFDYKPLWDRSLAFLGTVCHLTKIPPEAITRYTVIEDKRVVFNWMEPTISLMNHKMCSASYRDLIKVSFGEMDFEEWASKGHMIEESLANYSENVERFTA